MAGDGKIILHSFWASSCSWRVRIALAYKEIPFETKTWNASKGEHLSEEYTKINPLQLIPALEIDGEVITDSIVILQHLEERFPDKKPLLPKGLKERAAIRSVVNIVASQIQPLQNPRVLQAFAEKAGEDAKLQWAQKWIVKGFRALEIILGKTSGKYSFGDDLTLADVVLLPQIQNAHRYQVDMGQFPTLETISKNLMDLKVVVNTRPDRQPGYNLTDLKVVVNTTPDRQPGC